MSTSLSSGFNPQFSIDETQPRRFRVAFTATSFGFFRIRGKYADVVLPGNGVVEVKVCSATRTQEQRCAEELRVWLTVTGLDAPIELGVLTYFGQRQLVLDEVGALEEAFTGDVQRAFFEALAGRRSLGTSTVFAAQPPEPAITPRKGRWRFWTARSLFWKVGGGVVALFAAGLISYGLIHGLSKPKDPIQQALAGDDYKELQDKIRQQIGAADNSGGAFGSLQGQNIAIDTMRAMGLDPGKANSGCLVGVK